MINLSNKVPTIDEFIEKHPMPSHIMKNFSFVSSMASATSAVEQGECVDTFGVDFHFSILLADDLMKMYIEEPEVCMKKISSYILSRDNSNNESVLLGSLLSNSYEAGHFMVMRIAELAINDFRLGSSETAKKFIKSILNRYRRKDVKRICRYKEINKDIMGKDILPPDVNGNDDMDITLWLSFVLCVADLYNIKMTPFVYGMYGYLNDKANYVLEKESQHTDPYLKNVQNLFPEAQELYEKGDAPLSEDYIPDVRVRKLYNTILSEYGYCGDYIGKDEPVAVEMDNALLVAKTLAANKIDVSTIGSSDRNLLYGFIMIIGKLLEETEQYQKMLSAILGFNMDSNELIEYAKEKDESDHTNETPEQQPREDSEPESELKLVRAKLHNANQKIALLNELLEKSKTREISEGKLKEELSNLKREVVALRTFVYESTEGYKSSPDLSEEEMIMAIKEFGTIAIVGGDDNWCNKLRKVFPDWKFFAPQETGSVPVTAIDSAKAVYFFAGHICHPQYLRFLYHLRKNNTQIGYLARVNVKDNIRQIYNDLIEN